MTIANPPNFHCLLMDPSDQRWEDFITSRFNATIFHHPAWIKLLADCYGFQPFVFVVCDDAGNIRAGIPIMEIKSILKTRRWVSLPFTDYCVPLFQDMECLDFLANGLFQQINKEQIKKVELRWEIPLNSIMFPFAKYKLQILKLEEDFEKVASHFDRIHRQNVRQAEKNQIRVERGQHLEDTWQFYKIHLETRRRHGVPSQPWRYFKLLNEQLIEKGFGFVLLAYHDNQCIAGMILLNWQKTITCKYAASREESMKLRPNNLLFWTAIKWGCENHFMAFDMGRTDLDNPGLIRFKQGWGADEIPLSYFTTSKNQNQTSGQFENLMKPFIQRSPLWICRFAGELFYRYAG